MSNEHPTIGILYPGEMGAALGRLLLDGGFRVVTTLAGRSASTSDACRSAGLEELSDVRAVAAVAQVVISLVPPAAAMDVCQSFRRSLPPAGPMPTYIDANSVSPDTTKGIECELARSGMSMIDASIHGLARNLHTHGTLYVSGPEAASIERMLRQVVKVKYLGDQVGTASLFKMLLGGMSKGLVALFVEVALAARQADLLDEFLPACREWYPGVMTAIDRMLPTYPRHAQRRAEEMGELESTIRSLRLRPGLVCEVHRLIAALGESPSLATQAGDELPTVRELLEQLHLERFVNEGQRGDAGQREDAATRRSPEQAVRNSERGVRSGRS